MGEALEVNGVRMDSHCYMLADSSGLMITPEPIHSDTPIAGMNGELESPRTLYAPGQVILRLAVFGCLADGTIPPGSTESREFFARRNELIRMFHARPVRVDYTPDEGVVPWRRAVCKLDKALPFERTAANPDADVVVALRIPGSFWTELADVTASASLVSGGILSLAVFEPSNAPIADSVIRFGPGNNPSLIQGATYVAYDGIIPAGGQLVIDCADWSVAAGPGTAWTPDRAKVRYGPGPAWFELDTTAVPLQAVLTHTTGTGVAMDVSVTGKRRFLTS